MSDETQIDDPSRKNTELLASVVDRLEAGDEKGLTRHDRIPPYMGKSPKARSAEADERRVDVARLYLRGMTVREMGQQLGVHHSTIETDLEAIRAAWRGSRIRDYDAHHEIELRKLDALESEAWKAWERSKEDAITVKEDAKGTQTITKGQAGDPRFLETIKGCIIRRSALLGLDAPKKLIPLTPEGQEPSYDAMLSNLRPNEILVLSRLYRRTQNLEHEDEINGLIIDEPSNGNSGTTES